MRPANVNEAWAMNKRNVRGDRTVKYLHIIEIVSEHNRYLNLEDIARDATEGDAFLREWRKINIETIALTTEENDFFFPIEVEA